MLKWAFIHFKIHTRHFYLPSPSSSGPRLARTSVHNNRLYLWFQFSHCTALLTVLTAASGVWDIGNCGSRSLSQISPVNSLAKFTRLLAVFVFAKINHVSSECSCSSWCFSVSRLAPIVVVIVPRVVNVRIWSLRAGLGVQQGHHVVRGGAQALDMVTIISQQHED